MNKLKIMTFNVRYDNEEDPFLWADRIEVIEKIVKKYAPDVINFQEVKKNMYSELKEKLGIFYDSYGLLRSEDEGAEMCAVFIENKRLKVSKPDTFWLSDSPNKPYSIGWDAVLPRITSFVTVKDTEMDEELFVMMNAHFDHEGVEARIKSAELLIDKMGTVRKEGLPVILAGDFNVEPSDETYEILASNEWLGDSYSSLTAIEKENSLTFHDFNGNTQGKPIDYIFVSEPYTITRSEIIRDTADGVFPSDHYPVMVQIEKK